MIFKHLRNVTALVCAAAAFGASAAPDADEALLGAFEAYRAGDPMRLAKHARSLEGHVLAPWVEYWRLALRLEDASADEVRAYLGKHAGSYPAERLRADWLKLLGRHEAWTLFDAEREALKRDDAEIRCLTRASRLARGEAATPDEAAPAWLDRKELPEGCALLAEKLLASGRLTLGDVWQRVRVLFEAGQITAAKRALGSLPKEEQPDERLLYEAARQPQRLLRQPRGVAKRATREVTVLAALRLAHSDPRAAAEALQGPLLSRLPPEDQAYLWGRVGHEGARRHYEEALAWYGHAGQAPLGDEALAWKARAALRRGRWQAVRDAIDPMSAEAREDPAWTYWYGRALAAQGQADGAKAYYLRIAGQADFYGLLAIEELGYVAAIPEPAHAPKDEEVAAAGRVPGLERALELFRLGLRSEAVREWVFTIRGMEDRTLLAAAELARRAEVYDRAINTADRTKREHNFGLRYLAPFREVFREYARGHGLEEAWVLGLVRQESRFIVDARSVAGARGLMQLMPRTASWVARKIGFRDYHPKRVAEVETNVTLGTGYLKMVLDDLGHPLLASAAYNAGPGRARRWRDARPLEGAVYAETIPFNETRDYVKKVMANAVFYAVLLEGRSVPLKERLGLVPARAAGERVNEELP